MINKKIRNLTDELHWKTINYLVKNYDTILIGNMSSKGIVSKDGNWVQWIKDWQWVWDFMIFMKD